MSQEPLIEGFEPWTHKDTRAYLDANPVPVGCHWLDNNAVQRAVRPSHSSVTGYGKWLQETPYFPGLFELIHGILANTAELGDADWLAGELDRRRPPKQPNLF